MEKDGNLRGKIGSGLLFVALIIGLITNSIQMSNIKAVEIERDSLKTRTIDLERQLEIDKPKDSVSEFKPILTTKDAYSYIK